MASKGRGVMFKLASNPWLILALCGALTGAGAYLRVTGYNAGYAASEAKNAEATRKLTNEMHVLRKRYAEQTQEFLQRETERQDLDIEQDAGAIADPDAGAVGLSPDSLRRLDAVR